MNQVLETTRFVVQNAKHVKINKEAIVSFCKSFEDKPFKHWITEAPVDLCQQGLDERLNFLLLFNSISFCYWGEPKWAIDYKGKKYDGSWAMICCIARALDEKKPVFDPDYLAGLSKEELASILRGNVEIPLLNQRLRILNEVGSVLKKKFGSKFKNLIEQADHDGLALVELILKNFKSFEDSSFYNGKKIFFNKRAQLLTEDIYQAFGGKDYGKLRNIDRLTACADYKLPQVLRKLGILIYSEELSKKVNSKLLITKDSEEEVEIRASTIWAVEMLKEKLKQKIPGIKSININDQIWLISQVKSPDDKPYHRTLTTSY